jgi:hypothetical protein
MLLIPSIDLRGGRCVRLLRGDFAAETRYDTAPDTLLERYAALGAPWLHVVDLDGARDGRLEAAPQICHALLARDARQRVRHAAVRAGRRRPSCTCSRTFSVSSGCSASAVATPDTVPATRCARSDARAGARGARGGAAGAAAAAVDIAAQGACVTGSECACSFLLRRAPRRKK